MSGLWGPGYAADAAGYKFLNAQPLFTCPWVSLEDKEPLFFFLTKNLLRRQWQGEGGHYSLGTRLSSTEKEK